MEPKLHMQAEANAEDTSGPHAVGRPPAAPHHMVAAAHGGRHRVVFHLSFGPVLYFHLWPYVVLYFGAVVGNDGS